MYYNGSGSVELQNEWKWPNPPCIVEDCHVEGIEVALTSTNKKFIKVTFQSKHYAKMPWLTEYEVPAASGNLTEEFRGKLIERQIRRLTSLLSCFYSKAQIQEKFGSIQSFEDLGNLCVIMIASAIAEGDTARIPLRLKVVSDSKGWGTYDKFSWVERMDSTTPRLQITDYDLKQAEAVKANLAMSNE